MNTDPIRASISEIEGEIEIAHEALDQLDPDYHKNSPAGSFYEDPEAVLHHSLDNIFEILGSIRK